MVEGGLVVVDEYGRHHFLHIRNLTACRYDNRARSDDLAAVGIFLCHGQRVLTRRNIDLQGAAEVAQCFYRCIETRVLAFLRAARPHPVGRQGYAVQTFGKRSPNQVGQCLADGEDGTGRRVGKRCLRSVSQRCCDTFLAAIIQSYDTAVAQRQLKFALALLAGNLACYGTVYLVCQPVFAGNGFQLEYVGEVFMQL